MYVYCVYPAMPTNSKQFCQIVRKQQTIVVLIVFNCVLCDFRAYTVTVFTVAPHESGARKAL